MVSLILCIFRIIKRIATLGKVYSPGGLIQKVYDHAIDYGK